MEIKKYDLLSGLLLYSQHPHGLLLCTKRVWTKAAWVLKEDGCAATLSDRSTFYSIWAFCIELSTRFS